MFIYKRTLVVHHHPPHEFIPYEINDATITEINAVRYAILEYYDEDTESYGYFDIPTNIDTIDPDVRPVDLIVPILRNKPIINMFIYDHLRDAELSFSLGDVPGRHVHNRSDIIFNGKCGDTKYTTNSLFAIGGLIHRTNADSNINYIIDGGITAQRFINISRVYLPDSQPWTELNITSTMLTTTSTYMENCVLHLNVPPGPNEVPIFVIGGYLVPLGGMVTPLSRDKYSIDLTNSHYLNRMVDYDGVFAASAMVDGVIDIDIIKTDAHIASVFDASQTFVIYVKANACTAHLYPVSQTSIPGRYVVTHPPALPLLTGHGNMVDYVTSKRCNCHMVYTNDDRIKRYLALPDTHSNITTGLDPTDLIYRRTTWLAIYVRR